jgi:uncharacterized protein YxeA
MKKIFALILSVMMIISLAACGGANEATPTPEPIKNIKTVEKEITEINVSVEFNNVTIFFEDGDYIQVAINAVFFTKTSQNESVVKTRDDNDNLIAVHVFYNPNTTKIN